MRDIKRSLHNMTIFVTQEKRVDFSEVTGVRALFFRNLSVGETAGPDTSGQCGGGKPARHCEPLRRGGQDSPIDKLLKRPAREPRN